MNTVKTTFAVSIAGVMILGACTAPDAIRDHPNGRTTAGAVIGGITGALIGSQVAGDGNRATGAIIGGVAGAGAGALIGNNLDRQAEELRRDIGDDRIRIENTGSELIVDMPNDILFATDSASLRSDLQGDLRVLAENLQRYPGTTVEIIGHTDNTGTAQYNQDLSARRASSVANVLIGSGVSVSRIQSYGRGEDQPRATNLTDEGKAQNRRVEIIIRPEA